MRLTSASWVPALVHLSWGIDDPCVCESDCITSSKCNDKLTSVSPSVLAGTRLVQVLWGDGLPASSEKPSALLCVSDALFEFCARLSPAVARRGHLSPMTCCDAGAPLKSSDVTFGGQ